ncbi:uncharacterized protein LOC113352330 [Papaver somniferum]|uniref:uncharacterized protein LOC113352330 n=1 Tax=Papaver somniferum TaxID=3469 RepID=UPI000E6F67F7|nr:uncharacterized protein LOC113352330 [Papaver somniferum]
MEIDLNQLPENNDNFNLPPPPPSPPNPPDLNLPAEKEPIFPTNIQWKRSVERLWRAAKNSIQNGSPANVSSRMPKKIGRKKIQIDLEIMSLIPFRRRTNIRSTAKALGMSKTTVWRRIKDGSIKSHSNAIKPGFSLKTRIARLKHCLEMLDESVSPAVFSARPRYDEYVNTPFDGKIGMWAFVFMEAAKRKIKNRVAGTLEMKPIKSITQKVTREFLINKLLPAIIQKWPHDGRTIFIQQDNARPHIAIGDEQFCEAVRQFGLDARICFQPPNSPDLNVNDLGYFRSIDEHQHSEAPNTVPELVAGVEKSFREYPSYLINNVFLTLQTCMNEILKKKGDNDYYIPHMKKDHLIRIGELPTCIQCDSEVITAAKEALEGLQHQLYQQENETPHE